jgi:diadenosine tetraphosphate (Ap4A) HIT family hydrolase
MQDKGELLETACMWAEKLIEPLDAKAYVLKLNNNLFKLEDDALHVGHVHMHIVPRYSPDDQPDGRPDAADSAYFEEMLKLFAAV